MKFALTRTIRIFDNNCSIALTIFNLYFLRFIVINQIRKAPFQCLLNRSHLRDRSFLTNKQCGLTKPF